MPDRKTKDFVGSIEEAESLHYNRYISKKTEENRIWKVKQWWYFIHHAPLILRRECRRITITSGRIRESGGWCRAQLANIPINLAGNRWETMIGLAVR